MTSKKNSKTNARAKKAKATKATPRRRPPKGGHSTAKATSPTLAGIAERFLAHLDKRGKTASTVASYRADLGIALRHFGPDTRAGGITPQQVALFNACAAVTKTRAGKAKAKPSVEKTRRVLRLALVWASEGGLISKAPVPEPAHKR